MNPVALIKVFLHTLYTWLMANLLNPLFFLFFILLTEGASLDEPLTRIFLYSLFSVVSLPCLAVGWICLSVIRYAEYLPSAKFLLWLVTAPLLIFFEFLLISFMLNEKMEEIFLFMLPSLAAVVLAIIIRYHAFKKTICPAIIPVSENPSML